MEEEKRTYFSRGDVHMRSDHAVRGKPSDTFSQVVYKDPVSQALKTSAVTMCRSRLLSVPSGSMEPVIILMMPYPGNALVKIRTRRLNEHSRYLSLICIE